MARPASSEPASLTNRLSPSAQRGPSVFPFRAELDITEIDSRSRPGVAWTGRATELSRSHLSFRSRKMCYEGREVILAVHLVDDRPVALYGVVTKCDYDGDGLYKTFVTLLPLPEGEEVRNWVNGLHHRPQV